MKRALAITLILCLVLGQTVSATPKKELYKSEVEAIVENYKNAEVIDVSQVPAGVEPIELKTLEELMEYLDDTVDITDLHIEKTISSTKGKEPTIGIMSSFPVYNDRQTETLSKVTGFYTYDLDVKYKKQWRDDLNAMVFVSLTSVRHYFTYQFNTSVEVDKFNYYLSNNNKMLNIRFEARFYGYVNINGQTVSILLKDVGRSMQLVP